MTCPWCGDHHGPEQLCQRAQRGLTRRSFCFLFGAGVAVALVAKAGASKCWYRDFNGDQVLSELAERVGRRHVYRAEQNTAQPRYLIEAIDTATIDWP